MLVGHHEPRHRRGHGVQSEFTSKIEINYWCVDCGLLYAQSIFDVHRENYSLRGLRFLDTGSLGGLTSASSG